MKRWIWASAVRATSARISVSSSVSFLSFSAVTRSSETARYWATWGSTGPSAAFRSIRISSAESASSVPPDIAWCGTITVTFAAWLRSAPAICWVASTSPPGVCRMRSMYRATGMPRMLRDSCRWISVITRDPRWRSSRRRKRRRASSRSRAWIIGMTAETIRKSQSRFQRLSIA